MNEKHPLLPWVVIADNIYDAQDNPVACPPRSAIDIEPWPWHAHRDLIIRAVNSHAAILKALKVCPCLGRKNSVLNAWWDDVALPAIALAEGQAETSVIGTTVVAGRCVCGGDTWPMDDGAVWQCEMCGTCYDTATGKVIE